MFVGKYIKPSSFAEHLVDGRVFMCSLRRGRRREQTHLHLLMHSCACKIDESLLASDIIHKIITAEPETLCSPRHNRARLQRVC